MPPAAVAPVTWYDPYRWEVRGGLLSEIYQKERGAIEASGEVIFPRLFRVPDLGWADFLIPRFHMGVAVNLSGKTSFAYAGPIWTLNYTERFFGQFFVGATVHNGKLDHSDPTRNALGCRELFYVGINEGYRFTPNLSVMLTVSHSSSGNGLTRCPANQSLNEAGIRLGYQF